MDNPQAENTDSHDAILTPSALAAMEQARPPTSSAKPATTQPDAMDGNHGSILLNDVPPYWRWLAIVSLSVLAPFLGVGLVAIPAVLALSNHAPPLWDTVKVGGIFLAILSLLVLDLWFLMGLLRNDLDKNRVTRLPPIAIQAFGAIMAILCVIVAIAKMDPFMLLSALAFASFIGIRKLIRQRMLDEGSLSLERRLKPGEGEEGNQGRQE